MMNGPANSYVAILKESQVYKGHLSTPCPQILINLQRIQFSYRGKYHITNKILPMFTHGLQYIENDIGTRLCEEHRHKKSHLNLYLFRTYK